MFIKTGMKPNRGWRIKDVKEYFGITGSKDRLLEKLERIKEVMLADSAPETPERGKPLKEQRK